jgi:hypothetical protein
MSTYSESYVPEYRHGEYVRIEVASRLPHPISVWMRVEYCDDKRRILYGVVDDDGSRQFGEELRSGAKLAATFRQVRERRSPW